MKKLVATFLPVLICISVGAQNLFTYGNKGVTKDEFVRAFNKNPPQVGDKKKALQEYLDLYINFKLKVQAAYDEGLDKDAAQLLELENFKQQIADNILNEEANVSELVKEAFERSQKDLKLSQVFIEVAPGQDTSQPFNAIKAAYDALKKGAPFAQIASNYSNDAYTQKHSGDMGYITVFTLPYEFEHIAYNLKNGSFSEPFRSKIGYHIFKREGDRPAVGTRRVAQILFALPPGYNQAQREKAANTADSVYNLLQQGATFATMVQEFSNDINSVNDNGLLPEFGIGDFDSTFEAIAYKLKKDEISKPFATQYGYHIIRLVDTKPVSPSFNDAQFVAYLKEKVQRDSRLTSAKKSLTDKHLNLIKYKAAPYNAQELWMFTDSFLANKKVLAKQVNDQTVLFSFATQKITAGDWVKFVKAIRSIPSNLSDKSYPDLMQEYVKITGEEYYKRHLADYNKLYNQQIKEFKEANMLFGIMDKYVWKKANADSVGLLNYYNTHKNQFLWSASADAILVTAPSFEVAKDLQQKLKTNNKEWRSLSDSFESGISADSGRYEFSQLPVVDRTKFEAGIITAPIKNDMDDSYSFNVILKVYPAGEQRSFEDAKGIVISEYQQTLEQKWLNTLRKKYPVKVNQVVLAQVL